MNYEENYNQVENALEYMIQEGMVKKVKGGYRLKTELELEQEMEQLINESSF